MFVDRIERLFPSPATKHLCQNAEGEGEQHPRPVHLVCQHMLETREILTSVHPIKDGSTQQDGEDDFGRICQERFHFHGCKDSANRAKYQIYLDISPLTYINEYWIFRPFCQKNLSVCANSRNFAASKEVKDNKRNRL